MAQFIQYSKAIVYVNDYSLTEETNVSLTITSGAQQVKTVAKGFSGMSPGAAMVEMTVDSAVPSTGFELDPNKYIAVLAGVDGGIGANGVTFKVLSGDSTFQFDGFIISSNFGHGVDAPSKLSFTVQGKFESIWT